MAIDETSLKKVIEQILNEAKKVINGGGALDPIAVLIPDYGGRPQVVSVNPEVMQDVSTKNAFAEHLRNFAMTKMCTAILVIESWILRQQRGADLSNLKGSIRNHPLRGEAVVAMVVSPKAPFSAAYLPFERPMKGSIKWESIQWIPNDQVAGRFVQDPERRDVDKVIDRLKKARDGSKGEPDKNLN
jgi:hypothetical protein